MSNEKLPAGMYSPNGIPNKDGGIHTIPPKTPMDGQAYGIREGQKTDDPLAHQIFEKMMELYHLLNQADQQESGEDNPLWHNETQADTNDPPFSTGAEKQ
jgi:hypothetical protein